jgi:hypothetical protein
MSVCFTSSNFAPHRRAMENTLAAILNANPHSTLQVVLEPKANHRSIQPDLVEGLLGVCYRQPNYLDRYYSLNPQGLLGSKRVVISMAKAGDHHWADDPWSEAIEESATLVDAQQPAERRAEARRHK